MKEAGTSALLFFLMLVIVLFLIIIGVFVLTNGDLNKVSQSFEEAKNMAFRALKWAFPKLSNVIDNNQL